MRRVIIGLISAVVLTAGFAGAGAAHALPLPPPNPGPCNFTLSAPQVVQVDGVAYPWGMGAVRGSDGTAFTTKPMSPDATTAQELTAIWPGWGMAWVALSDLSDQVRKMRSGS